jgi:hypothetical protein
MHTDRIVTAAIVAASIAAAIPAFAASGAGNAGKHAPIAGGPAGVNPSHGTGASTSVFTLGGGAGINPSRADGIVVIGRSVTLGGGAGVNPSGR